MNCYNNTPPTTKTIIMKLQLINNKILKEAFESISHIVDEITMTCDNDGLYLRALSRDHITFIIMDLNKTLFDIFDCQTPEKIAIDSTEFHKILRKCKPSDTLEIETDEHNLTLIFKGDADRTFRIRQLDLEYENPEPPIIQFPCTIELAPSLLKDIIDDMEVFADRLNFSVDEDYFITTTDADLGDAEVKYIHGENIKEYCKSSFSIPKLKDILRASKFSDKCRIHLGNDAPIKIEFIDNGGVLGYLLAPRLETE